MNLKSSNNVVNIPKRHAECNFNSYKVDDDNSKQFEICKNWEGKDSIILTGKPGTGKTHLAISMLKNFPRIKLEDNLAEKEKNFLVRAIENKEERYFADGEKVTTEYYQKLLDSGVWQYRKAVCLFVSFVEMFVEINNAAISDEGKMQILRKYSLNNNYDCVCFDDLGAEKLTDAKRENLYYVIDARYKEMLPTIITSNFTINEISQSEPRIASRFAEMGAILQFNGKDFRKK